MRVIAHAVLAAFGMLLLLTEPAICQEDLGHKVVGTLGLDAGTQAPPGLYFTELAIFFGSHEAVDQQGTPLPIGLDLAALGAGFGVSAAVEARPISTYLNFAVSLPVLTASISATKPNVHVAISGVGDLFIQPLRLGWRLPQLDLVTGYGVYLPTGRFEISRQGNSVAASQWTHEASAGGTLTFDAEGRWRLSALASYDFNAHKVVTNVTLGQAVQVQGGLGVRILRVVDLGVVGYALWQTTADEGSVVSPSAASARDRAFALGAELGFVLAPIRSKLTIRYEHDLAARSSLIAQVVFVSLTILTTSPVSS